MTCLLGNFEESILRGRLKPVASVPGFMAEIGASGSFCPNHVRLPVTTHFFSIASDTGQIASPYTAHIGLSKEGYRIPAKGTVQVAQVKGEVNRCVDADSYSCPELQASADDDTFFSGQLYHRPKQLTPHFLYPQALFNLDGSVVRVFIVPYNLTDMPPNSQTFTRQRTLFLPIGSPEQETQTSKWLRYLIHVKFVSSKSGRIYLHKDIKVLVLQKSDLEAASIVSDQQFEVRSVVQTPFEPRYSPR